MYYILDGVDGMTVLGDKATKNGQVRRPVAGGTYYGIHPERYDYWRVGYGTQETFALNFWIERVGRFQGKANYGTGHFHWTHSSQIFYHLAGEAIFEYHNRTVTVSPGDMMIIPPHQHFYYRGPHIQYNWLALAGEWPLVLGNSATIQYLSSMDDKEIKAKFTEIREVLIFQQYGYPIKAVGIFYELVARLKSLSHNAVTHQSMYPDVVRNAMVYLTENYNIPFNAPKTAAAVNISPSRLRTLFKQWLGESPRQYHTRYRINQASRLLREQRLLISEVATEVGYDDVRYFSRVFKRILEVSPSQFMKEW